MDKKSTDGVMAYWREGRIYLMTDNLADNPDPPKKVIQNRVCALLCTSLGSITEHTKADFSPESDRPMQHGWRIMRSRMLLRLHLSV